MIPQKKFDWNKNSILKSSAPRVSGSDSDAIIWKWKAREIENNCLYGSMTLLDIKLADEQEGEL